MTIIATPANMTAPPLPLGRSAILPIFEIHKPHLATKQRIAGKSTGLPGNPQSSLGIAQSLLQASDWQLFHAAAKTELARSFTTAEAVRRATCFSFLFDDLFAWNGPNFRLQNGAVGSRKDSVRTNAAGRFGEAFALLFMQGHDYYFWDHLPTLWQRLHGPIDHAEQVTLPTLVNANPALRPIEQPDFICESPINPVAVALVEAKGSFISPAPTVAINTVPSPSTKIKSVLQEANAQLVNWPQQINPQPSTYAIGTFLREATDTRDPSLIAYTDPPGDEALPEARRLPPDFIRRGNYGAWLVGMGFEATGNAIRNRIDVNVQDVELRIISVGNHHFAIRVNPFLCPCLFSSMLGPNVDVEFFNHLLLVDFYMLARRLYYSIGMFEQSELRLPIIGIEVETLRLASSAAQESSNQDLLKVERILPSTDVPRYLSVFADGTLFGHISWQRLHRSTTETFRL